MIILSLIATTPIYYVLSLIFLGIGWNFLFLGGSSLIVKYTKPEEKGKVQGIADFIILLIIINFIYFNKEEKGIY